MTRFIGVISGKGGVGKSLSYSEYISLADGDVVEIGDFVDELINKQKDKVKYLVAKQSNGEEELFEVLDSPENFLLNVIHFDQRAEVLFLEKKKPICLMRKPAPKKLIRIRASVGTIEVTPEHKFIVMRNGRFIKVKAQDLRPKKDYLLLLGSSLEEGFRDSFEDVAEFLGYLIGDGYIEQRRDYLMFHVFVKNDLIYHIKESFKAVFGSYKEIVDKRTGVHRISFCSKEPIKRLCNLYGLKKVTAENKFIPKKIFSSDNKTVSAFIRALFDCDGYVARNRLEIQYDTKSKRLIFQVASLLRTKYGIFSQIKRGFKKASNGYGEKREYWRLNISGRNSILYDFHIGFKELNKKKRLNEHIKKTRLNTNIDVFPVGSRFRRIRLKNGLTAPQLAKILNCTKQMIYQYERDFYALSDVMVLKFVEVFRTLGIDDEDLIFLTNLVFSKYRFRRVDSIEEINYDKPYVYDFQVSEEGSHFVHSTGIVVSNTTTAINLAGALSDYGKEVIVVDGNLTTPNIGVHLGNPVLPITLNHALQGKNHISEAIYENSNGMKVIPASISVSDLKKTDPENLSRNLRSLYGLADVVVLDGSAGLGKEAIMNIDAVDEILVVTNPELPAITDALKTIRMVEELGKKILGVVVCRTKEDYGDLSNENIESLLDYKILSVIPEDDSIRKALNKKDLVVSVSPKSKASLAYRKLAADLIGKDFEGEKKGFFKKILEKLGW